MKDVCGYLHESVRRLHRFRAGFDVGDVPLNGIYLLFEKGECSHGGERIVRVGTHTGQNNLPKRLAEHLYAKNKDRSIFRKHIGRCLLRRDNHPYAKVWEYDLTKTVEREKYSHLIDVDMQVAIEDSITEYMIENFSFSVIRVDQKENRLSYEEQLIATLASCEVCNCSSGWLGKWHPNANICSTGIWNIQGQNGELLLCDKIDNIFKQPTMLSNPA